MKTVQLEVVRDIPTPQARSTRATAKSGSAQLLAVSFQELTPTTATSSYVTPSSRSLSSGLFALLTLFPLNALATTCVPIARHVSAFGAAKRGAVRDFNMPGALAQSHTTTRREVRNRSSSTCMRTTLRMRSTLSSQTPGSNIRRTPRGSM